MVMVMNYEEKYNAALERAKKLQETCDSQAVVGWCEYIFPELKESKDDKNKRISKEITQFLKQNNGWNREWLTWLEKQGEQNFDYEHADISQKDFAPIEPKFKVGDWIIFNENHNSAYKVDRIDNYRYYLRHYLGGTLSVPCNSELIRLWTIQDAKDGDVLVDENTDAIGIFEGIEGLCWHSKFYYSNVTKEFYGIACGGSHVKEFAKPATKEQCNLLFQKMADAGYKWDAEKKELEKMEVASKESENKRIRKAILELVKQSSEILDKQNQNNMIAWLEEQEQEPKKVSIWKHWKNGICGNGEGKQIFLIKIGNTYTLSSCLGFECDYIELSELDNLMPEKQNKTLDADKVMEWLKTKVYDDSAYGMAMIEQFKKDFGL